jgi:DNA-binding GntR family transcriptional regulator
MSTARRATLDGERQIRPKGTGARVVFDAVRQRILTLAYEPGMDLEEAALVAEFGVSRTPVREALIRLASEKLVTLLPNRGARVAGLSLDSVRQFFEALSLTQRAVTRWAALRSSPERLAEAEHWMAAFETAVASGDADATATANREFHIAIASCSGNTYVERAYRELLDEGMRLSRLAVVYDPPLERRREEHLGVIMRDHRGILAAVRAGDADRAEALAKAHAELFRARVTEYIQGTAAADIAVD